MKNDMVRVKIWYERLVSHVFLTIFLLAHFAIAIAILFNGPSKPELLGEVEARNWVRSSFSWWAWPRLEPGSLDLQPSTPAMGLSCYPYISGHGIQIMVLIEHMCAIWRVTDVSVLMVEPLCSQMHKMANIQNSKSWQNCNNLTVFHHLVMVSLTWFSVICFWIKWQGSTNK